MPLRLFSRTCYRIWMQLCVSAEVRTKPAVWNLGITVISTMPVIRESLAWEKRNINVIGKGTRERASEEQELKQHWNLNVKKTHKYILCLLHFTRERYFHLKMPIQVIPSLHLLISWVLLLNKYTTTTPGRQKERIHIQTTLPEHRKHKITWNAWSAI